MLNERSGRYQIIRSLAAGGMAEVFLARVEGAAGFSKLVALKRIHAELADDHSFVERFIDEARIASQLNHPNIVQILDLGLAENTYFIAMEYVHGKTLWDLCREAAKRQVRVPLDVSLGIMVAASEGLGFAHDQRGPDGKLLGIVHRDVSPQNLLVTFDGAAKVADFGIARAAGRIHKTEAGAVVGKLSYMSPEQMLGETVDQRADIYALGVILHELLTGLKLFQAIDLDPTKRKTPAPPSSLNPAVPPALDAVTMRALAIDPNERYPTCDVLRADLEAVMAQQGIVNSTRRRAELMQAWFPEDRAAPLDPGPAPVPVASPSSQMDTQRNSLPTVQLEMTPLQVAATKTGPTTERRGELSAAVTVLSIQRPPEVAESLSNVQTQVSYLPDSPTRIGGGPISTATAARGASATPTSTPRGSSSGAQPMAMIAPARPQDPISLDSSLLQTPQPDLRRSRGSQLATILGSSVIVGGLLLYLVLRPGPAPAPPVTTPPSAEHVVADPPPIVAVAPAEPSPPPTAPAASGLPPRAGVAKDPELDPHASRRHHDDAHAPPKKGALTLAVTPPVQVYLGRTLLGRSPLKDAALPAGRSKLRLVDKQAGIELAVDVDVRAGETADRTITIGKARLRIKAKPWAAVTIDGHDLGTTPLPPQSLYAGAHAVTLTYRPEGAAAKIQHEQLLLTDGEDRLLEADLR